MRLWDARLAKSICVFEANGEVNGVAMFPTGAGVAIANDNGTTELFCARSYALVSTGRQNTLCVREGALAVSMNVQYIYVVRSILHVCSIDDLSVVALYIKICISRTRQANTSYNIFYHVTTTTLS